MAILEIKADQIVPVAKTTLAAENLRERGDLQRLLKASIEVLSKDVMILAEEFGSWEDSKRRVDLLGLDREGNLVVIELKRTDDGGHMELQALRYAAMTSVMTFDHAVDAHQDYLARMGDDTDAREAILEFLQWDEPDEELFAQDVRIILASMDFSKEITTTVLWLNQKGIDIRCLRLTPHKLGEKVLLDVQQIIPLPETAEYQTRLREKELKSVQQSASKMDFTKFTVTVNGKTHRDLPKRHAVLQLFKELVDNGLDPEDVAKKFGGRRPERTIRKYNGLVDSAVIARELEELTGPTRGPLHPRRWFHKPGDLIRYNGNTYIVNNQWGRHTEKFLRMVAAAYPDHRIEIETAPPQSDPEI